MSNWKFISNPNKIYPKINWLLKVVKKLYLDKQSGGLYSLGSTEIKFESDNDAFNSPLHKAAYLINNSSTFELTGDYFPYIKITYEQVDYSISMKIKAVGTFGVGGEVSVGEGDLFITSKYFSTIDKLELGETEDRAYRGDRGKIAYDHSEIINANPHLTDDSQIEDTIDYVLLFNNAMS